MIDCLLVSSARLSDTRVVQSITGKLVLCDYILSLYLDAVVPSIAGKLVLCDYALSLSTLMLSSRASLVNSCCVIMP